MTEAQKFYHNINGLTLKFNSAEICNKHWKELGYHRARGSRTELKNILKRLGMRRELRKFFSGNPFDHYRTNDYIIFTWNSIEYFYEIEN